MRAATVTLLLLSVSASRAQLPDSDIWLLALEKMGITWLAVNPVNITDRKGYDNQPKFSDDGKSIWYTSIREDKQADVYKYAGGKSKRITFTAESEYSPTPADNESLACVVVEKDSVQKIHYINATDGAHTNALDFDSVGYFLFLNADTLVYFKVGEPAKLVVRSLRHKKEFTVGAHPVRGMCAPDRHTFLYGLKEDNLVSWYRYDLLLAKAERIATGPAHSEDIFYDREFGLMRSGETSIYVYDGKKEDWRVLFDLSALPVKKIGRFAMDAKKKRLVVVGEVR
jgi:hypothetical protein